MPVQSESYWVGALSMTVAIASRDPEPQPLLRSALREFLAARPPGDELGDMLREELKARKT